MEIRCKKGDCKHNTGCSCDAKSIMIERGSVTCASYVKDSLKENLIIENGNIFQVAEELVERNTNNVPLECQQRSCLYNKDLQCLANGITVIDNDAKADCNAECATFIAN